MRPSPLRALQILAAGSAVFALLGACGIPVNHPQRPRYHRVRPIVIRLSGTWDAVPIDANSFRPLRLTLRRTGASVDGVLDLPDRTLVTEWPAHIDDGGQFDLVFGRPPETVRLSLRISGRPIGLSGTLTDPGGREPVRFVRR